MYVAEQDPVAGRTGLGVPEGADPIWKGTAMPMVCGWVLPVGITLRTGPLCHLQHTAVPHPSGPHTGKGAVALWGEVHLQAGG